MALPSVDSHIHVPYVLTYNIGTYRYIAYRYLTADYINTAVFCTYMHIAMQEI